MKRRHVMSLIMLVLVLVVVGSLATPDSAQAVSIPTPLDLLPGGSSLNPVNWAVDSFKAILKYIFGDQVDDLGRNLMSLLLAIPLLTDKQHFVQLNNYREYVSGAAWGILGLSFVVSSLRYWLSSYAGSGAYEAMQGFMRTTVAIMMLMIFPIVFDQLSRFVNAFTSALVVNDVVGKGLGDGLVGTMTLYTGGGFGMIIGLAAVVMAFFLLIVKVVITALLAVLFVASPLAIALWPIEETSFLMKSLFSAIGGALLFPIIWALCFATFAVLNTDALFPGRHGSLIDSILSPLVILASLIIAFRLPFKVMETAIGANITSGMRSSYAGAQSAGSFARTRLKPSPTSPVSGAWRQGRLF